MPDAVHLEVVDRLLACLYQRGGTMLASFGFGRPGAARWDRNIGTQVFVDRRAYTEVLIFVRASGAPYLRAISIGALWSMMTTFVTENFWYIAHASFLSRAEGPYSSRVGAADRIKLADALASSSMFSPLQELTLYPLVPVRVAEAFECERFLLLPPDGLTTTHLPTSAADFSLNPRTFPPTLEWAGVQHAPGAWLGVRSPLILVSDKMRNAILGAVSLSVPGRQRYMNSGRKVFGGWCTFGSSYTVSMAGVSHAPPLMDDVTVGTTDHKWLARLAGLLDSDDLASRRKLRALEYFHRAWFLDPRERFPVLCMALDSLVGASDGHTSKAIAFVQDTIDSTLDGARLKLLMRVRGAVVHGAAPDVYDSENYARYYVEYGTDPIRDVELVVARCLRERIFEGDMQVHTHPKQALLDDLRAKGRIGSFETPEAIVNGDD